MGYVKMYQVKDIMTKNPICCLTSTNLKVVARLMLQYDCGEIPVLFSVDRPKIVGVITDRDIVCRTIAHGFNPLKMTAKEAMSSPVIIVKREMKIDDCCTLMEEEQLRRIPVVDDEENCCGIVTLSDISQKLEVHLVTSLFKGISNLGHSNIMISKK